MLCEIEHTNIDCNIYRCTDSDSKQYRILDRIDENKFITETIVVEDDTLDEVQDSELFKRVLNARQIYSYILQTSSKIQ